MFSPALAHRQRVLARNAAAAASKGARKRAGRKAPGEKAAPAAMPEEGAAATEYRQMLAMLHNDLRQLSEIRSIEKRIAMKPKLLEKFLPWVSGALSIGEGDAPQDEIVLTAMIWALDIGKWQLALDIADHCIAHGLEMPERYNRGVAGFVVEEVAAQAIKTPCSIPHDVLERIRDCGMLDADMADQAKAKFHRAMGESWRAKADIFDAADASAAAGGKPALVAAALAELQRALALDENVGVKKLIEQLTRDAKKLAEAAGQDDSRVTVPGPED